MKGETRSRIPQEMKKKCLESFLSGNGYKKTASMLSLNKYTVRDYKRKFSANDISWVSDGSKHKEV